LKLPEKALESFDRAISLKPDLAEAHTNRGTVLSGMDRFEDALACHDAAIRLRPDFPEAHNNRGNVLRELDRATEAVASYDTSLSLKPDYAEALSNRGNALRDLDRLADAIASFDAALALSPDEPGFHYNKSVVLLQRHAFPEGFRLYQWRWDSEEFGTRKPETQIPHWDGAPPHGRLLLWAEQGLGDEVFYASMLSLLDEGLDVTVSADRRIHPVYSRSFPGISLMDRQDTQTSIKADFAAQAAIGDLGHLLRFDSTKFTRRRHPYLLPNAARRRAIVEANPQLGRPLVCGLSWRSGNKKTGASRSISLTDLAPVLRLPGFTFVNLQYGDVTSDISEARAQLGVEVQRARDVDVFKDVEGLLSLIDLCDVVLTIDNVTAHLAGAIGKKGVVLIPAGKGRYWYWGGEDQSLWYPSLRLVYQENVGDWTPAIAAAAGFVQQVS